MGMIYKTGVLPANELLKLIEREIILTGKYKDPKLDPSMLGLYVSGEDFRDGAEEIVLEPGENRTFKLNTKLIKMPEELYVFGDGNTTNARAGISVEIRDGYWNKIPHQPETEYGDEVTPHPRGELCADITSHVFRVSIKPGFSPAQLRVFRGNPKESILDPEKMRDFVFVEDTPIKPLIEGKYAVFHLNLDGGYVSKVTDSVLNCLADQAGDFFDKLVTTKGSYEPEPGKLGLFNTVETLDMTGGANGGEPFVGFMRKEYQEGEGSIDINMATMLEPEPPTTLAVEILSRSGMKLPDWSKICHLEFYPFCTELEDRYIKKTNRGNNGLPGGFFK